MAKTELNLKVEIDPKAMNDIKRALHKDIAEVVESAYREGWYDGNSEGITFVDDDWNESDTKKKLDEFLKM